MYAYIFFSTSLLQACILIGSEIAIMYPHVLPTCNYFPGGASNIASGVLPPPPSRMSAGGRFGGFGGGYGVTGLLRTFIFHPPLSKCKNFRLRNTTLGGSTLAISRPLRKISEGGKIAIYIFDTSPCFQLA